MYRHFYIGELKPEGSLKELKAVVEQELQGTDVYVGEVDTSIIADNAKLEQNNQFRANVAFLLMQQLSLNIVTRILIQRKIPTAILSFTSPLSTDDLVLSLKTHDRKEFLDYFQEEADFIGYFVLQFPPAK
jgi:hypothetical protein